MKKLICALMLAILLLTLCGCGIARGSTYPNANKYAVGSFTYDAVRVSAVEINWTSGRVELLESDSAQLSVTETTEGLTEDQQMRWWLDGSTLRIQYWKSGYSTTMFNKEKRIVMEIPKDITLSVKVTSGVIQAGNHQLKDLSIKATSGDIHLGEISTGGFSIGCTSGNINVGPIRAQNKLEIGCTSGNIVIENAMADSVTLNATSGNITSGPLDAAGAVNVNCTSGNIKLDAVKAKTVKVHSTSGTVHLGVYQCETVNVNCTSADVTLAILHGSGATVDFKTTSGDLNGKSVKKSAQQVFGDGASKITVSTTSGDLKTLEQ